MNIYKSAINISFDEYKATFKNWIHNIVEKLTSFFKEPDENKTLILTYDSVEVANDFFNFFYESIVAEIKETSERIANFLKTEHILIREYYDFREIQRLLNKSLDENNEDQLEIISILIQKLNELTDLKFDLLYKSSKDGIYSFKFLSDNDKRIFEEKYDEFSDFFFDCKTKYYSFSQNKPSGISKKYFKLAEDELFN